MKTYIGRSVPRLEDPPLVRGRGRFAGDISFPYQLHMRLARSPVAHGRVVTIDTSFQHCLRQLFDKERDPVSSLRDLRKHFYRQKLAPNHAGRHRMHVVAVERAKFYVYQPRGRTPLG